MDVVVAAMPEVKVRFGSFLKSLLDGERRHLWPGYFYATILFLLFDYDQGTRYLISNFIKGWIAASSIWWVRVTEELTIDPELTYS